MRLTRKNSPKADPVGALGAAGLKARGLASRLFPVRRPRRIRAFATLIISTSSVLITACSGGLPKIPPIDDLNPFKEKTQPLPGKRVSILPESDRVGGAEIAAATLPVTLPPPTLNPDWSQAGGAPDNAPGHLALNGALRRAWSVNVGTGSGEQGRLTSQPIVYQGTIFTLDAASTVSAVTASSGAIRWRRSLVPEKEAGAEGYGGGLAVDSGRLYVSTGFGRVAALDPGSGKVIWEKNLGIPVRAAPTAVGDRIFLLTRSGLFYCLSGVDGSELWQYSGLPQVTSLSYSPNPGVSNNLVVVPYPSGDVVALNVSDGMLVWQESLSKTRTSTSLAAMSDAASPAVVDGMVYAIGHGGRFAATQQANGERDWTMEIGGVDQPWVAGSSVFVVDTRGQLFAVDRKSGQIQWVTKLKGSKIWSGPVLAGGRLWLTSTSGELISVEATTGKTTKSLKFGNKFYIAPVVANNQLYVLSDDAQLTAFR